MVFIANVLRTHHKDCPRYVVLQIATDVTRQA